MQEVIIIAGPNGAGKTSFANEYLSSFRGRFVFLNVEMSIERVRRRVAQGGHGVPEDVIRKRFSKSLDYFDRLYRPLVNEWYIWDSLEGRFQPAEKWDD